MARSHSLPETRASLIVRLPDAQDAGAWREFAEIYEPFVYQFARRRGLQDGDARELVQEVFLGVAKSIRRWKPDRQRARFRTWLFRIARNQLLTRLQTRRGEHSVDSDAWRAIEPYSDPFAADSAGGLEYRREIFHWVCQHVQRRVRVDTWTAFWQTSVVGRPVEEVARQLGVAAGFVYVARSRVIRRLRDEVERMELEYRS
jgi:RNA polymerase sigma-70 factor (ECF subfamily)